MAVVPRLLPGAAMRALLLLLTALSSSSCVMLLVPGLGLGLGASAQRQYEREGREREAAHRAQVTREAALARCLASKGVPTPEDVGRIRHLYIRLDRRVDGQRLLTGKRRETRETLRGLLVRWEELGAGSVDPILRSGGGGERDTWEDIWHWADKHRLAPREDEHAEDSDTPATPTAKPEERALAYLFENRWRQMTKQ